MEKHNNDSKTILVFLPGPMEELTEDLRDLLIQPHIYQKKEQQINICCSKTLRFSKTIMQNKVGA